MPSEAPSSKHWERAMRRNRVLVNVVGLGRVEVASGEEESWQHKDFCEAIRRLVLLSIRRDSELTWLTQEINRFALRAADTAMRRSTENEVERFVWATFGMAISPRDPWSRGVFVAAADYGNLKEHVAMVEMERDALRDKVAKLEGGTP